VRSPGTVVSDWVRWRGLLVAGSTDSQVVAVRPSDLRTEWTARVDAPVLSTPGVRSDSLFVASRAGTLYVIPPSEHPAAKRVLALSWPVTAPVAVAGDEILLGGADGTIRAFRADGWERWRVRVWRPVELAPVVLPDGLLAVGGNGDLHRYRR
jgi:PQQ-like domain